jgi:hypothetical protein
MPACHVGDRGASPLRGSGKKDGWPSGLWRRFAESLRTPWSSAGSNPAPSSISKVTRAGVTQLVERRLLSDPMGVRVLSPAPIIPRWRNGKRSGPRPRGPREGRGSSTLPLGTRTCRLAMPVRESTCSRLIKHEQTTADVRHSRWGSPHGDSLRQGARKSASLPHVR